MNYSDHINYLDHCRTKMLHAINEKRWSDAAEYAKSVAHIMEDLERLLRSEALLGST